jgi:hypothetical protein
VTERRPAGRRATSTLLAAIVVVAALVVGCGSSFDPTGPCVADGSAPGAYPELEAAVPKTYAGTAPGDLDSGRTCTKDGLGTLAGHAVTELRYAGAIWSTGSESGVSLVVFANPNGPLDASWLSEFYQAGAAAGKNVTSVDASDYPVRVGVTGRRIDVLNGESYQSVVAWEEDGRVAVALVADSVREIETKDAHEKVVRAAVDAFGA